MAVVMAAGVGCLALARPLMASPSGGGESGSVGIVDAANSIEPDLVSAVNENSAWPLAGVLPEYALRIPPVPQFELAGSGTDSPDFISSVEAFFDAGPLFTLAVRPREFTFSELLLNPDWDPQSCIPGYGLHLAIAVRDLRLLERLLQMGVDPNAIPSTPIPPCMIPMFGDEKVVYYLSKDSGVTPLMLAILTRQTSLVRLLLKYGADTERFHTRKFHLYPLDFAAQRGDVAMMQLLLGRGSSEEADGRRIVVSLSAQDARFWQGSRTMLVTQVSTGKPGYRTPPGEYVVTQKYRVWRSDLYKVPMPNFMRLNCGPIGLHGGYVPDVPASHGCIRLPPGRAALLFTLVKVGDRVSIVK